jgi:broad specificity phosphatase PhoE
LHVAKCNLGGVYTAKVKGATGLGLTDVEAERPSVNGSRFKKIIGEVLAMHLGNNIVVIMTGHILRQRCAVDVKGGITESVRRIPTNVPSVGRYKVKSTGRMIEICEINIRGSLVNHLILGLGD